MNKEPFIFLKHILASISRIEYSIKDISKDRFLKDFDKQDANIRRLEVIGEAIKNINKTVRDKYPGVSWSDVARTRDKLIHHYFGVDLGEVWDVIIEDIPKLKKQIQKILEEK